VKEERRGKRKKEERRSMGGTNPNYECIPRGFFTYMGVAKMPYFSGGP
jgi:hypothetical protein